MEASQEDRVLKLEKKVKRLEFYHYVQVAIIILGFVGVTSYLTEKFKKMK